LTTLSWVAIIIGTRGNTKEGTGTGTRYRYKYRYGLDKQVWVYKSVFRQKLVKTFDSDGFKFLIVKAEYLTLRTFFPYQALTAN
jgi:hypothetical protein